MKKKVIFPVVVTIWTLGIIMVWEIFALMFKLNGERLFSEANTAICVQAIYKLIFILSAATIILYFILSKVADQVIEPIKELTKDAKSFVQGEYKHQLRNYKVEEIQNLANAFDNMEDELNGTIRRLSHQKVKAESVLASLDEGLIVMDTEGYVTELNQLASEILNLKIVKYYKNHITTILRSEELTNLLEEAFEHNKYGHVEVNIGEKIIYMTILPVREQGKVYEYLLIMRDITQMRALEEMKYQFVSNVSHELKTPLTSIQGFVETLKEGAIDDKTVALKFLNIIDVEAKRLYRLIQDILLLSEIESMERQEYEDIDIGEEIPHIIDMLKEEADKKHIEILFKPEEDFILPNVNIDHFKQLMINLITNAIKYTDKGTVTIKAAILKDDYMLSVQDTGIGIPEESISHIFERFYRVDKSRSRKSGGTGLGLSIVKHIVQLYGAQIRVTSKEGEGTTFTLTFKK